jgi:hypothetical protein
VKTFAGAFRILKMVSFLEIDTTRRAFKVLEGENKSFLLLVCMTCNIVCTGLAHKTSKRQTSLSLRP